MAPGQTKKTEHLETSAYTISARDRCVMGGNGCWVYVFTGNMGISGSAGRTELNLFMLFEENPLLSEHDELIWVKMSYTPQGGI